MSRRGTTYFFFGDHTQYIYGECIRHDDPFLHQQAASNLGK